MHDAVNTSNLNYRIGTIHSIKGETFDATLVILKDRASNKGKYSKLLTKESLPFNQEELRIVYVGITRPRVILTLAVPNSESKLAWENMLNGANLDNS